MTIKIPEEVPPNDIHSEICALGSMILNPAMRSSVRRMLKPEMFYRPAHQIIFNGLCAMMDGGDPINLVTFHGYLAKVEKLEIVGGAEYLTQFVEGLPDSADGVYYAKCVKERALARELILAGRRLVSNAYHCMDATELLRQHEGEIFQLSNQSEIVRVFTASEAAQQALDRAQAVAEGKIDPGVMSGFPEIDAATGGFQPGDFVTLAADTSVGKSALALGMAFNIAQDESSRDGFVFYVSAEMKARELGNRLLASISGVSASVIKAGRYNAEQLERIMEAQKILSSLPLMMMDSHASAGEILEMVRHKDMLDISHKHICIGRPFYYHRCGGAVQTDRRQQCCCPPMAAWCTVHNAPTAFGPAVQTSHIRLSAGLVHKDQASNVQTDGFLQPIPPSGCYVWPILLGGMERLFLKRRSRRTSVLCTVTRLQTTAVCPLNSANVMSG